MTPQSGRPPDDIPPLPCPPALIPNNELDGASRCEKAFLPLRSFVRTLILVFSGSLAAAGPTVRVASPWEQVLMSTSAGTASSSSISIQATANQQWNWGDPRRETRHWLGVGSTCPGGFRKTVLRLGCSVSHRGVHTRRCALLGADTRLFDVGQASRVVRNSVAHQARRTGGLTGGGVGSLGATTCGRCETAVRRTMEF